MSLSLSLSFRLVLLLISISSLAYAKTGSILTDQELKWIEQHPTVIVGSEYDWTPYDFRDQNDTQAGFLTDILKLISEQTGLKFKQYPSSWQMVLERARADEIDLIAGLYFSKDRAAFLDFSRPLINVYEYLFVRSGVNLEQTDNLSGKIAAIPRGYQVISELKKIYPDLVILEVDDQISAINAVLQHRADLLVDSYVVLKYKLQELGIYNIESFRPLRSAPLHMATTKNHTILLTIINKALDQIDMQTKDRLMSKWIGKTVPKRVDIGLTLEEKSWIQEHQSITLGADFKWVPFEFDDLSGRHSGISADILELVRSSTGLNIEIVSGVWSNILHLVQDEDIDGLACAVSTPKRLQYLNFTAPYASVSSAVITKNSMDSIGSLRDLVGKTVSVNKNSYLHEWLAQAYPDIKIVPATSNEEALESVAYGRADAYIGNLAVASHIIKTRLLSNLTIALQVDEIKTEPAIAIRKDLKILSSIVNKAIDHISFHKKQQILSKWNTYSQQDDKRLISRVEREWLRKHRDLIFVGNPDWLPFEAFDERGEHVGMVASYLRYIEDELDVEFDTIRTLTLAQTLELAHQGAVDVVSGDLDDKKLLQNYRPTAPYLKTPIVIIMHEDSSFVADLKDLSGKKIAIVKGYGYISKVYKEYAAQSFVETSSPIEALELLDAKRVDAMLLSLPKALYLLREEGLSQLKIVGKTSINMRATLFVNRDSPELYSLIDRVMQNIPEQKKYEISSQWSSVEFATKVDYTPLYIISFIFTLIAFLTLFWMRKLRLEVSKTKEVQRALKREKDNFRALFESSPDGSLIIQNNRFIECNSAALKMLGLKQKSDLLESTPNRWSAPIQPDGSRADEKSSQMLKYAISKGSYRFEWLNTNIYGNNVWIDIVLTKIIYDSKVAFYVVWRDISEHKAMLENFELAKDMALAASRTKSNFLANMSHEIRTPMNAIIGFTELLDEQIKEPKLRSYIKTVRSAGETLMALINDILDLSKIEAGKLLIQYHKADIALLIEDTASLFMLNIRNKNLKLTLKLHPLENSLVMIDEVRVRQILFNLIGNAIKFTQEGEVEITLDSIKRSVNVVDLLISVKDSGIGIPQDQLSRIFGAFEQRDGQDNREYGGTGLGLAISSRLCELMGGKLSVTSQIGAGSTFTLTLYEVQSVEPDSSSANTKLKSTNRKMVFRHSKILLVDDIANNREVVEQMFAKTNIEITTAVDGKNSVELCRDSEFDLVLMDLRMPIMDGYEATRAIREFSSVPIIALSASIDNLQHTDTDTPFEAFLQKPIRKSELFELLSNYLPHDYIDLGSDKQEELRLSDRALQNLDQLLKEVSNSLDPAHSKAILTHNIEDISHFASAIRDVAEEFEVEYLIEYAVSLEEALDAFDISSLQTLLHDFILIREKLISL